MLTVPASAPVVACASRETTPRHGESRVNSASAKSDLHTKSDLNTGRARPGRAIRVRSLAALTLAALAVAAAPLAAGAQELNEEVRALMGKGKLGTKSKIGVSIVDVDRGTVLASIRASDQFTPASNMKVLTSGAAVLTLGTDFAFRTEIIRSDSRLIIKGSGDPALADPELLEKMSPKLTVGEVMDKLAGAVAKDGMTSVSEIIVDDRIFDRDAVQSSWPTNQLNRWYCAEVSGLNFHTNVLAVFPRPSPEGPGKPPPYTIQPPAPWVSIDNKARTSATGQNTTWLSRTSDDNRFQMFGEVRFAAQVPVYVTLHDPATFFGKVFAGSLASAGVAQADGFKVRVPELTEQLPEGKVVAVVRTPLEEVLKRCNKDSHNLYAESLMKRIGHDVTKEAGSWSGGASVVRMLLSEKLGPEFASAYNAVDGSGMSKLDQVTPLMMTRWLEMLAKTQSVSDTFINSMATNGEGTLEERFRDSKLKNELRAKSGAINNVRCLSGYLIAPSGKKIAFSVLCNDLEGEANYNAMRFHEEVVKMIDGYLAKREGNSKAKMGG